MEHNFSEEIAHTRDTFLTSELDYLKQLSQVPEFWELYNKYKNVSVSELSQRLVTLTEMMENGQVNEDVEGHVELDIMCCCLAIEDAIKTNVKVLTPYYAEEELSHGRER